MTISERTLVAALCALLCALILTRVIHWLAVRYRKLDVPNARSSHGTPIPRLGGVAIVVAFFVGIAVLPWDGSRSVLAILAGGLLLALIGLYDDLHPIHPSLKYPPQIAAAALAAWAIDPNLYIAFPFVDAYISNWVAFVLSVLWITAVTNAFNFMDGLDGLAAGCGAIAAIAIVVLSDGANTVLLVPLAMALLGFLMWNTHPAMIFMGDTGSQFTGFVLAAAMLLRNDRYTDIVPMIIVLIPLLFDTGYTILRRWRAGENVFAAHRSHLYQRLHVAGLDQRTVANIYYVATGFCGAVAVAYAETSDALQLGLIGLGIVMMAGYVALVMRVERHASTQPETITRLRSPAVKREMPNGAQAGKSAS